MSRRFDVSSRMREAAAGHGPAGLLVGVLGVLAWAAVACSDPTGAATAPGIDIVSGASGRDSIGVVLSDPLAVVVVDSAGHPAAGREVSFTASASGLVLISHDDDANYSTRLVETTDARGRAAVRVRFFWKAGDASVIVRVSPMGIADTARYKVEPGAAAAIELEPRDTAVYVGARYTVRATVTDWAGNPRTGDAVAFSPALGSTTLDRTLGVVTTTELGRASVAVRAGNVVDTAWVSVAPHAWVAAQQHVPGNGGPIGIFLMQLDGSGRAPLASGLDNAWVSGQGFGWSPDGQALAIARGDSVDLASPGLPERRVAGGGGQVLLGARFSRDGQWIYFARAGKGIFRLQPDGTGQEHLGYGGTEWGEDYRPSPSPDGRSVAYGSSRSPCGVTDCIRVLDIATGAERVVASGTSVAWSPAGDLLAYASPSEVGLVHADGSGKRVLATDAGHVGWMDWSPDGRWLLVSPGVGPVLLFDTTNGTRMPLATLNGYGAAAWRPDGAGASLSR
jgi:hypothetical protein